MTRPLAATAALILLAAAEPAARPNVVLILADDLGWKDVGCAGSAFYRTPHIDRLAATGVRFTRAYAACPVCSPTRAALLTGRYPPRLGITDWLPGRPDRPDQKLARPPLRDGLAAGEVTLAELLGGAGYATASIGKWHLGGAGSLPEDHGFGLNVGGTHQGTAPGGYFTFRTPRWELPAGEYLTDWLAGQAERYIDAHKGRPFFLYLPHYAVHTPIQPKPDVAARYRGRVRPGDPQNNPAYAAMVESLDDAVGRVLRKLDETGLADRTLVVFTSDNGGLTAREGANTPATSNAPLRAGKGHLYEGGVRVPLVVRWPGVGKPGTTCDAPAVTMDVFATAADAAGVPAGKVPAHDGVSLRGLLAGGPAPDRALFWHYPHYSNQGGKPGGAVLAGGRKLIESYEDGRRELYDPAADPGESADLADREPDAVARLAGQLAAWRRAVGAKMPTPNPGYRPPAP